MYLGIRKDLIIVTLPYIDRPLADHILISFLIESSRSINVDCCPTTFCYTYANQDNAGQSPRNFS